MTMKKLISLIITLCIALSCIIPVNADLEITVNLNNNRIIFDQPPILQNDRTLVPMRAIFEAMNCDVVWHDDLQQIVVWKNDKLVMNLQVGRKKMILFDIGDIDLDVPPLLINNRTLVPLRAISESMGAEVIWNDYTQTVDIYYSYNPYPVESQDNEEKCNHTDTIESTVAGVRDFENTGSSSTHKLIEYVEIICEDCGETIKTNGRERTEPHNFENGICVDCGYEKTIDSNDAYVRPSTPTSSGSVYDYVDGAFLYVAVPYDKNIKIPNTSNGNLKIQMDGVYNCMECKDNGKFNVKSYNDRDEKGSISIAENSYAIIQNSGYDDLIVSIPAEYAEYHETNDKVYDVLDLTDGENANIEHINKQNINVYFSNQKFEYIKYTSEELKNSSTRSSTPSKMGCYQLYSKENMLITAKDNIEIFYCPATTSCQTTSQTAFKEYNVNSGGTIRIYSDDESSTRVHTDGSHTYDYVIYKTDGKVKEQKQNCKKDDVSISKKCYMDFTNTSSSSVTIKVPSMYCRVEY